MIRRRSFLAVSLLTPMLATTYTAAGAENHAFTFAPDGSAFLLDGKPFQIRGGEMHPVRIPVEYWRHRVQMAKAMGMNTIAVYLMWNYLEERPGEFDLTTGRRDFAEFIRICQQEGMWVILRPGPYVCAEWDLGGLPAWLLREDPVALRVRASADKHYMPAVRRYVNRIAPVVKPLLVANGGPVLMIQVENEYGSYGNDTTYLAELRQMWLDAGIDGPFYTQDGLSQVKANKTVVLGGAIGLSGGDAAQIAECRKAFPAVPALSGELYPGWLTHWNATAMASPRDISGTLRALMDSSMSFNIYMLHGGTNFGYWAGANANDDGSNYGADVTSYDYGAPINEQGRPTVLYTKYRDLIGSYVGTLPNVPAPQPTVTLAGIAVKPHASLWDNLPGAPTQADNPRPMEAYGQNSGFMLYRRTLPSGGALTVNAVHDYATVFLDGKYQGGISRPSIPASYATQHKVTTGNSLTLPAGGTLDILVEGLGRTNFGHALIDRKGITHQVSLAGSALTGWRTYRLPVDDAYVAGLKARISDPTRPGIFFKGTFTLTTAGDAFVDMSGWTMGVVWVNGNNLGRYWRIGPQQRLYCPASWLKAGPNEITVFDLHQLQAAPISLHAKASEAHTITNRHSGKTLDVPGSSTTQGTQLIQWSANGGTNQQWNLILGEAATGITNVNSGMVVDVEGASTVDGARIIQWPANGGTNQKWRLVSVGDGYVKLVSELSGKVLGVAGESTSDGAAIVQQTDSGSQSQHWKIAEG